MKTNKKTLIYLAIAAVIAAVVYFLKKKNKKINLTKFTNDKTATKLDKTATITTSIALSYIKQYPSELVHNLNNTKKLISKTPYELHLKISKNKTRVYYLSLTTWYTLLKKVNLVRFAQTDKSNAANMANISTSQAISLVKGAKWSEVCMDVRTIDEGKPYKTCPYTLRIMKKKNDYISAKTYNISERTYNVLRPCRSYDDDIYAYTTTTKVRNINLEQAIAILRQTPKTTLVINDSKRNITMIAENYMANPSKAKFYRISKNIWDILSPANNGYDF